MLSEKREKARRDHMPDEIKCLFILESPPEADDRFFYYDNVDNGDILFLELMGIIFPDIVQEARKKGTLRKQKPFFLKMFMDKGFFLIDAMEDSLPQKMNSRNRRKEIKKELPRILGKIRGLKLDRAKVIIVKATVHHEVYNALTLEGLDIINDKPIDFPGRFTTKKFREKMVSALEQYRALP